MPFTNPEQVSACVPGACYRSCKEPNVCRADKPPARATKSAHRWTNDAGSLVEPNWARHICQILHTNYLGSKESPLPILPAISQNPAPLVNLKIAGIYGCPSPQIKSIDPWHMSIYFSIRPWHRRSNQSRGQATQAAAGLLRDFSSSKPWCWLRWGLDDFINILSNDSMFVRKMVS
jgi:hypothetical protein